MSDLELAYVPLSELLLRLGAAALFSFLLGVDREIRHKSFGLRTHMLLCIGTTAFVLIMMELSYSLTSREGVIQVDPTRVVQGIIIGISFLAAGTIIRSEHQQHISGATTGAGIWMLGAIGLACGLGLYIHAAIITAILLFIVVVLALLDNWLQGKRKNC